MTSFDRGLLNFLKIFLALLNFIHIIRADLINMSHVPHPFWNRWRADLPAALVVFLVALPLCLGVALASGAPLFAGIIAGIVGGIIVGTCSSSSLSVSGPAAGLTVVVLKAIQGMPSFEAFLLAVFLAGAIQIGLSIARVGAILDFIPSSVIEGMLVAIGLIIVLKQIPHAMGYDADYEGDLSFTQLDGENTFSMLAHMFNYFTLGAVVISILSLIFLFWWDKKQPTFNSWLCYLPGPLVVVTFGILINQLFYTIAPQIALAKSYLVAVPVADSFWGFFSQFRFPDFRMINQWSIWSVAIVLALIASVESLLSIEAVDKLDPYKRVTSTNRELWAQGVGNMASGLLGGLPVTSVIVRSSANVAAGAKTKLSTIGHGTLLLLCVLLIPSILNMIPLAALAAVLIAVGYKLAKPSIFIKKYKKGWFYFIPFIVTIISILFTDLLRGIGLGVVVGMFFVIWRNFYSSISLTIDGQNYLIRAKKDLFFIHKYELKRTLRKIPEDSKVLIDLSQVNFIDLDNVEILKDFLVNAEYKGITATFKNQSGHRFLTQGAFE